MTKDVKELSKRQLRKQKKLAKKREEQRKLAGAEIPKESGATMFWTGAFFSVVTFGAILIGIYVLDIGVISFNDDADTILFERRGKSVSYFESFATVVKGEDNEDSYSVIKVPPEDVDDNFLYDWYKKYLTRSKTDHDFIVYLNLDFSSEGTYGVYYKDGVIIKNVKLDVGSENEYTLSEESGNLDTVEYEVVDNKDGLKLTSDRDVDK